MNAVFVFGSNRAGAHAGGAARHAMDSCGAIWGQAEGLQGSSYAIPTMDEHFATLPPESIAKHVATFVQFARDKPGLSFVVTAIGCGIAGLEPRDIAPMFAGASENVFLSAKLVDGLA